MTADPDNDNEADDLVYGEIDCSFDELLDALRDNGADVQRFLLTDEGGSITIAND